MTVPENDRTEEEVGILEEKEKRLEARRARYASMDAAAKEKYLEDQRTRYASMDASARAKKNEARRARYASKRKREAVNAAMKYVLSNPEYKNQEEEAAYLDNLGVHFILG